MYFGCTRIRFNNWQCKVDAFYLRKKDVCILFALNIALTIVYVKLVSFTCGVKRCVLIGLEFALKIFI